MKARLFLAALAAVILCTPASAAAPATAASAEPWSKVPALPTACYATQDQWLDQNSAALYLVQQDHYRQNDINGAIRQKATDTFGNDPMALAQQLQQKMMEDPANARKYLEQMNQRSEEAAEVTPEQQEKEKQLENESKALIRQYHGALAKSMTAAEARWTALKKKMGLPMDATSPGEMGVADSAWSEWYAILRDRDTAYAANCAKWWSANGPMHAYMKRYKDYLITERIPYEKKFLDEPKLEQWRTMNVPTTGWRTTTDYDAAEDYMKMASTVFGERETRTNCETAGCRP